MEIIGLAKSVRVNEKTLERLEMILATAMCGRRRGAPLRRSLRFLLLVTLMRLRTALPLRLIARLFRIDHVTLWRYCNTVIGVLAGSFTSPHKATELIVDTTSTQVRSTDVRFYSGHKKQRVAKVQVLCDADGIVHSVSKSYCGSTHDKTIWNQEFTHLPPEAKVLADKAYVGGIAERTILLRPIRRNERQWKEEAVAAKSFNAALSKRRVRIEHLFARLKTWRIIHHYYPMRPESYSMTFKAIAYIHNLQILGKRGLMEL